MIPIIMMIGSLTFSSFFPPPAYKMIRAPAAIDVDAPPFYHSRAVRPSKCLLGNTPIILRPPPSCLNSQRSLDSNREEEQEEEEDQQASSSVVQDLKVPDDWLFPSKALQESEWLRVTLHKWLDDEYCPETTNIEISKVAAQSYYESLVGKQADLGEILLKMARDLQSISYQESFHGAFSSANAAVHLIASRIELE